MALGLDFSPSRARIARAIEHHDNLNEALAGFKHHAPIELSITDTDPVTGVCEIFAGWSRIDHPSVSEITGDLLHNLRAALDYTVTTLADASGATLRAHHQFPIQETRGDTTKPLGSGPAARTAARSQA